MVVARLWGGIQDGNRQANHRSHGLHLGSAVCQRIVRRLPAASGLEIQAHRKAVQRGLSARQAAHPPEAQERVRRLVDIQYLENSQINIQIRPGVLNGGKIRPFDSIVLERISLRLPPYEKYDPSVWSGAITPEIVDTILKKDVADFYSRAYQALKAGSPTFSPTSLNNASSGTDATARAIAAFEHQLRYESAVAGTLLFLESERAYPALEEIFYIAKDAVEQARALLKMLETENGAQAFLDIDNLDPTDREHLASVSPVADQRRPPVPAVLLRARFLPRHAGEPRVAQPGLDGRADRGAYPQDDGREDPGNGAGNLDPRRRRPRRSRMRSREAVKEENEQDIKFGASVTASYASIEATVELRLQQLAEAGPRERRTSACASRPRSCPRRSGRTSSRRSRRSPR